MRNGACVIWLLGWWVLENMGEYIYFLTHGKPFEIDGGYAFLVFTIWIIVAMILYERKER